MNIGGNNDMIHAHLPTPPPEEWQRSESLFVGLWVPVVSVGRESRRCGLRSGPLVEAELVRGIGIVALVGLWKP
ncbi:hypothetical protein Tco_0508012 [Tanacetum coccineum]